MIFARRVEEVDRHHGTAIATEFSNGPATDSNHRPNALLREYAGSNDVPQLSSIGRYYGHQRKRDLHLDLVLRHLLVLFPVFFHPVRHGLRQGLYPHLSGLRNSHRSQEGINNRVSVSLSFLPTAVSIHFPQFLPIVSNISV